MFSLSSTTRNLFSTRVWRAPRRYTQRRRSSAICLCITSRIFTIPPDFERLDIPTLSEGAAYDISYRTYRHGEHSDLSKNILKQLGFRSDFGFRPCEGAHRGFTRYPDLPT